MMTKCVGGETGIPGTMTTLVPVDLRSSWSFLVDIFCAMTEVRSKNARKHGRPLLDTWLFENKFLNGTIPVVG